MSRKHKPYTGNTSRSKLDVIITTGGRFDMLAKCLDALYREAQTVPLSIYLVDNNCPQDERRVHEHLFHYQPEKDPARNVIRFQTKQFTQDMGFPSANNEGARMGQSNLILFLNDDVELHAGALDTAVRRFDYPDTGIIGIKLIFPPDANNSIRPAGTVQHVGLAMNIRGEPVHPLLGWHVDNPRTCITRDVFAVTGAFLMVRRAVFNRLGGFDRLYDPGTFEDVDLCLRVRQAGFRIICETNATGYHYAGATQEKKRAGYPLQMNLMKFTSKWANSGLIFWSDYEFYGTQ